MSKPYHEMNASERLADRIAKNRKMDERRLSGPGGLSLEGIVDQLDTRKQRASYGAVAALVGVLPRGLMTGRPKSSRYSWVVAATNGSGSRRGWPTGYTANQMHPECLRQARACPNEIIEDAATLASWLEHRA